MTYLYKDVPALVAAPHGDHVHLSVGKVHTDAGGVDLLTLETNVQNHLHSTYK